MTIGRERRKLAQAFFSGDSVKEESCSQDFQGMERQQRRVLPEKGSVGVSVGVLMGRNTDADIHLHRGENVFSKPQAPPRPHRAASQVPASEFN